MGLLIPALLGACAGGAQEEDSAPESAGARPVIAGKELQRRHLDLLRGRILKVEPHYVLEDPDTGKKFIWRIYTEHHQGTRYEIVVITIPHGGEERLANWPEIKRARELKQAELRSRGERIDRALSLLYKTDDVRADTALDSRIKFKRKAIAELEHEMDRLRREIIAIEEFPGEKDQSAKLGFLTKQLKERQEYRLVLKFELQFLLYQRQLRNQRLAELDDPARR